MLPIFSLSVDCLSHAMKPFFGLTLTLAWKGHLTKKKVEGGKGKLQCREVSPSAISFGLKKSRCQTGGQFSAYISRTKRELNSLIQEKAKDCTVLQVLNCLLLLCCMGDNGGGRGDENPKTNIPPIILAWRERKVCQGSFNWLQQHPLPHPLWRGGGEGIFCFIREATCEGRANNVVVPYSYYLCTDKEPSFTSP